MTERPQQITLDEHLNLSVKEEVRLEQERLQELLRQEGERQIAAKKEKEERDLVFVQTTLEVVSSHYGVKVDEIIYEGRQRRFTQPRKTAQYIIFNGTDYPLTKISEIMGRADHTTAINAIQTVERRLQHDDEFKERVEELQDEIRRQTALRFYVPLNNR